MSATLSWLIRPRILQVRNRWKRADSRHRATYLLFLALTLGFWAGILLVSVLVLRSFYGVESFGPFLLKRLLQMMLLTFLGLLVFSNVVSALSSFYLSDDMHLLRSLPIPFHRVFYARVADTVLSSSWMMALFGVPVLVSYGIVYGSGPLYYLSVPVVLLLYLGPPAALGILIAYALVQVFPARRARDIQVAVGVVFAAGVILLLRVLRPEQLVNAESFSSLAEFFGTLGAPSSPWLPSTWAAEVLLAGLGAEAERVPEYTVALLTTAPASLVLCRWVVSPGYAHAWTKAQEARSAELARRPVLGAIFRGLTRLMPPQLGAMVHKDLRVFLRDAGQWSQAFLVMSLIATYLYNIHALQALGNPIPSFRMENLIGFLNIGVAGFVLAALSVRFSFTAVSMEGRAFWVLHASPLPAMEFLKAKFLLGVMPLLLLGEFLVITSNWMLGTSRVLSVLSMVTILGIAAGVTGLGVGMGALHPDFKSDSAARMAASPGAILFMVVAMGFVGLVVAMQAVPTVAILSASYRAQPLSLWGWVGCGVMEILCALLVVSATVLPLRRGARVLWMEGQWSGD